MSSSIPLPSASRRGLSDTVAEELERQNRALPTSAARTAHIAALRDEEVGVVVTGQQVGLFLGPAYSFYKAATAIAYAKRIAVVCGRPTVPIFWLQSEDHDADEVATCRVLDESDAVAEVTLSPTGHARASMSARALGDGVTSALDTLQAQLDSTPHGEETVALLRRHYRPDAGWVGAFAHLLGEVFAEHGLLVLDPRTPAMARAAASVHRRAFDDAAAVDEALQLGATTLERAGEPVLVPPRPGCSLSFYHPEGADGPRFRLERTEDGWRIPNGDMVSVSDAPDGSFSTSCLLRVVLQQRLLPIVGQIAGPGEARYLRQVPPLLAAMDAPPMRVVPRLRVLVVDDKCRRRLNALDIEATDIDDRDALLERLAQNDGGISGDAAAERLLRAFESELDGLELDGPLARAAERTRRHVRKGVGKLGERITRARAELDEHRVARVDFLCRRLLPGGAPQERWLSFPHFAAHFGLARFERAVFAAAEAHLDRLDDPDVQEVTL